MSLTVGAGPQMSNFPYGFSNGVLLRGVPSDPVAPGRVFWVYNGSNLAPSGRGGSDGNSGSFESPFATIAGALAQCTAGRGDIVYVKPGHSENVTAANGILFNVKGVQVIGLGTGVLRPTLTFKTVVGATLKVTSAQMSLVNFFLDMTGVDNLTNPLNIQAADFSLIGCQVQTATASAQCATAMLTNASCDGLQVIGNVFYGTTDAGTTNVLQLIGGDHIAILNNYFQGAYTASLGAINNITTACTNLQIRGNFINNQTASSTKAIVLVAGSTGVIADNRMQILSGTAPITGAGMSWVGGNYYAATIATAGTLI